MWMYFVLPQAFSEGNLKDVERRGPEQVDCMLTGAARPYILRAGQPQSKTDQWYSVLHYSLRYQDRVSTIVLS